MTFLRKSLRRSPALLGCVMVFLLALACAQSEEPAAAPSPAPAPSPTAAPAPAAPPAAPAAPPPAAIIQRPSPGPGILPAPIPGRLDHPSPTPEQANDKATQVLLRHSVDKLPLWTKASYGGEARFSGVLTAAAFDPIRRLLQTRPTYGGTLIGVDQGRCTLQGEPDLSTCSGLRAETVVGVLVPGVIQRWEQPEPKTYLLRIDSRAVWPAIAPMTRTDRKITSEDVAWYLGIQKNEGFMAGAFRLIDTISPVDQSTVKVTLKEVQVDFPRFLANLNMVITPKECYPITVCAEKNVLVSPGPFLVKELVPAQKTVYVKNPEWYRKGAPWLDGITTVQTTDPAAQKAAFITGQFDFLGGIGRPSELEGILKERPGAQVQAAQGSVGVTHFRPNIVRNKILADVRVRQALIQGVDWNLAWELAYDGFQFAGNVVSYEGLGRTMGFGLKEAGPLYTFNPEAARTKLANAGYPDGFEITMQTSVSSGSNMDFMLAIQAQWEKNLKVKASIKRLDGTAHGASLLEQKWTDLWFGTSQFAGPTGGGGGGAAVDDYVAVVVTGDPTNFTGVSDPVIDDLYRRERGELDPTKRRDLLWELQRYLWDQQYIFQLGNVQLYQVMQPWEMNATAQTYAFLGGVNGSTWTHMFDSTKFTPR